MQEEHLVVEFRAPHNPHVTKMEHKTFNQAVNQLDHNVYQTVNPKEALDMLRTLNSSLLQHFRLVGAALLAQRLGVSAPHVAGNVDAVLAEIANVFVYGPQAPANIPPVAAAKAAHVQLFYNVQLRALTAYWKCVQEVAASVDVTEFQTFKTDLEAACSAWREEWTKAGLTIEGAPPPEDILESWRQGEGKQGGGKQPVPELEKAAQRCAILREQQHKKEAKLFMHYFARVARCKAVISQKAKEALRTLPAQALESLPREFQVVKLLNYVAHVREMLEQVPTLSFFSGAAAPHPMTTSCPPDSRPPPPVERPLPA
jgi:hypothetical protein